MASDAMTRARAVNTVLEANEEESDEVKQAAVAAVGAPSQAAADEIWKLLIFGLLLLLVVALGGMLVLMLRSGSGHEAALTVFTTTLAGLIGLFAPSPLKGEPGAGGGKTTTAIPKDEPKPRVGGTPATDPH